MHNDSVTTALYPPARDCVKCRTTKRHARPQTEAGVVKRTAQLITDEQSFDEWTMVMRTASSHGEKFVLVASQKYILVPDSALDHSAIL